MLRFREVYKCLSIKQKKKQKLSSAYFRSWVLAIKCYCRSWQSQRKQVVLSWNVLYFLWQSLPYLSLAWSHAVKKISTQTSLDEVSHWTHNFWQWPDVAFGAFTKHRDFGLILWHPLVPAGVAECSIDPPVCWAIFFHFIVFFVFWNIVPNGSVVLCWTVGNFLVSSKNPLRFFEN